MKSVSDPTALVMDDVILASCCCPNETFAWKIWIRDDITRIPVLAWFCEPAVLRTKSDNGGWQVVRGMDFVEAR